MSTALRFLYLLALAVWIGEISFFSFVAAPAIFRVLDPQRAGEVVGDIFPRYYLVGSLAGALALATGIALALRGGGRLWALAAACVALGLAATLYAAVSVHPQVQRLRLAAAGVVVGGDEPEFRRLHRLAVQLNGLSLAVSLAALGLSAAAFRE